MIFLVRNSNFLLNGHLKTGPQSPLNFGTGKFPVQYFLSIVPGMVPNDSAFVSRFQLEIKMADDDVHHRARFWQK